MYRCKIKDLKGKILSFFAIAVPRIMGDMFCPFTGIQLRELFPRVMDVETLGVQDPVDYMIGLDEAGLQLVRRQKSLKGGEFYVCNNSFGRCIGGRHSLIGSAPRLNSAAMFTVIKTLYTSNLQTQSLQIPLCCSYSVTKLSPNWSQENKTLV